MPDQKALADFIATVVRGEHDNAIEGFYMEDSTMQENLGEVRRGRDNNVARERATLARFDKVVTTLADPPLVNGDQVVIHWVFEFYRADGSTLRIEELAHQRWQGNKIAEERFYYDPAQMSAK